MPTSLRRRFRRTEAVSYGCALIFIAYAPASGAASPNSPLFERDVWPIISARCIACHGTHEPERSLNLTSVSSMEQGGDSGPALNQAKLDASILLERISKGEMPPPSERQLSPDEIALLKAWILAGAPANDRTKTPPPVSPIRDIDRQFWSFLPLNRSAIPQVRDAARVRTPIDAFLLSQLEAKELGYSPDADPVTLVRRLYFDVIGLPPTPEQVDVFLNDDEPHAFETLVDRLLSMPQFGERWGRHWLDVAGYVDTVGFDTDATNVILSEGKWRYRDYVIQAFNDDKPYDRFLAEQIAGDELYDWRQVKRYSPEMRDALIATGFLRTARDLTHEDVGVIPQNFFGIMHDTLETFGTGVLGLTLNCVRCHSHKFDPIPQEDYYRLMASLTPAYNPNAWRPVIPYQSGIQDRTIPDVGLEEQGQINSHNAQLDVRIESIRKLIAEQRNACEQRLVASNLEKLPQAVRTDTKAALDTPAGKRSPVQAYLVEKFAADVQVSPDQITASLSDAEKAAVTDLETKIAAAESERQKIGKIQALFDITAPPSTHLLLRGSEQSPGAEVQPGYLRVLSNTDDDALAAVQSPYEGTSGRRLALAHWLTERGSRAEALVARVMVNRLWQHVFGRGLVATPDNFGAQGQPPTHPELLDWLSAEFVEGGWQIKPLLRQMLNSTAYRQASRRETRPIAPAIADPEDIDPANDLLWRMRVRRLESEVIRDAILSVCGTLNLKMGGPPVPISAMPDGMVAVANDKVAEPPDSSRRSVYLVSRRAYNLSLLTVFDQPLVATNCVERVASAVPLQSLFMLNDAFVIDQAEQLANRIVKNRATADEQAITSLFRTVLARQPNNDEITTCRDLLRQQTAAYQAAGAAPTEAGHQALVQLCHTLLNTSEFLYVE